MLETVATRSCTCASSKSRTTRCAHRIGIFFGVPRIFWVQVYFSHSVSKRIKWSLLRRPYDYIHRVGIVVGFHSLSDYNARGFPRVRVHVQKGDPSDRETSDVDVFHYANPCNQEETP